MDMTSTKPGKIEVITSAHRLKLRWSTREILRTALRSLNSVKDHSADPEFEYVKGARFEAIVLI